jgi:hypothetical protein
MVQLKIFKDWKTPQNINFLDNLWKSFGLK